MAWNDEVRNWLKEKNLSISKLAVKTGINNRTLSDYLMGRIKTLPEEKRKKLYEETDLEILANPVGKIEKIEYIQTGKNKGKTESKDRTSKNESLYNGLTDLETRIGQLKGMCEKEKPSKEDYKGKIGEIENLFYTLIEKMEYLKNAPTEEREKITRAINSRDMGYFISFMNAVYKPDTFNQWVKMSGYIPTKRSKK